jgi:hypothetical protein
VSDIEQHRTACSVSGITSPFALRPVNHGPDTDT